MGNAWTKRRRSIGRPQVCKPPPPPIPVPETWPPPSLFYRSIIDEDGTESPPYTLEVFGSMVRTQIPFIWQHTEDFEEGSLFSEIRVNQALTETEASLSYEEDDEEQWGGGGVRTQNLIINPVIFLPIRITPEEGEGIGIIVAVERIEDLTLFAGELIWSK